MLDWFALQAQLPLLDTEQLTRMERELTAPVLGRLLHLFLEDGRSQGAALSQAFGEQNYEKMARYCHSLTAACGSYAAKRCQYLSEKLEQTCKREDASVIAAQYRAWQAALDETLLAVSKRLTT